MRIPTTSAALAGLIAFCSCGAEKSVPSPVGGLAGDLEPTHYYTPAYQARLRQVLMERAPNFCDLQFLVMPSFQPETLLSIYRVDSGYEAQILTPKQQVSAFEGSVSENECREAKKSLPEKTAGRLCRIWKQMLLRTGSTLSPPRVLDGVGYVFMRYEPALGNLSGGLINPEEGTRPYVLAEIGQAVVDYVQAESASEQAFLATMAKFLDQLEASLPTK